MMDGNMMSTVGMGAGALLMILFWIFVVAGMALLVVWMAGKMVGGGSPRESALEMLKKRYARGEISKEEFEEKRRDIA